MLRLSIQPRLDSVSARGLRQDSEALYLGIFRSREQLPGCSSADHRDRAPFRAHGDTMEPPRPLFCPALGARGSARCSQKGPQKHQPGHTCFPALAFAQQDA